MSLLWSLLLTVVGLAVLAKSSDVFVEGAVALSKRFGVSPVVIGAVVIGFGTSMPELLVSVLAALEGDVALGVGNVVGSNVANLSLVLGTTAVIAPLAVPKGVLRQEAPLSFAAVALFGFLLRDGLSLLDAAILLVALVAVLTRIMTAMARHPEELPAFDLDEGPTELADAATPKIVALTAAGLIGTTLAAQVLITGALGVADAAGLSQGFVGVTLVAVGTSLPELVTGVQSVRKGHHDLIVGNVLGSNIFNSLAVGGAIALFDPGDIGDPALSGIGAVLMVVVAGGASLMMWHRRRVLRIEGVVLLLGWGLTVALLA